MADKIKVLFQSRVDLFKKRGGDTFQIENTKKYIEAIDPRFQIDISTEINNKEIENYDIVNLFNLDWICETYPQALWAKKFNKPLVLSAIHHSYSEVELYEDKYRYDLRRFVNFFIRSQEHRDILKNIYRSFIYKEKLNPTLLQIKNGFRNTQKAVLKSADVILVQTDIEAQEIKNDFGITDINTQKVVLGVNTNVIKKAGSAEFEKYFFEKYQHTVDFSKTILCTGRIEPRKNQLSVIEAVENLYAKNQMDAWKVLFIGEKNLYHPEYFIRFKNKIDNKRFYYLDKLPFELVASAMHACTIGIQPSWFETMGLTTIEAAVCDMNVITTCKRVYEYLGDNAEYCKPNDIESIQASLLKAANKTKRTNEFVKSLVDKYSWEETAKQTIHIYDDLLKQNI